MAYIKSNNEKLKQILRGVYQPELEKVSSDTSPQKKVIVLAGPTCVGKTALSLKIASEVGGEIVNADSMQVYRGLDIGTAKATLAERQQIPHHLIDIRDTHEPFTAVDFYHEAQLACDSILSRNKVPIITGGTGFYLHVLLYGPPQGPPSDVELRKGLENEMEKFSPEAMYDRLQKIDPEYAQSITSHDKVKIIRALEIISLTKKKVSDFAWNQKTEPLGYNFRCWFLFRARENLYNRINQRCEEMLKEGLVDEVATLKKADLKDNKSASHAIGYRQCLEYFETEQSDADYQQFKEQFKRATRRYAKRQFTWFRKEPEFKWLDLDLHDHEIAADLILKDYSSQDPKN
ncbi:MAG: tRNA dimethylallyltransferase [Chlamydiae bacterium]|nr:tRNA dimethylallyltransferase [Chlamydiota bacterium]